MPKNADGMLVSRVDGNVLGFTLCPSLAGVQHVMLTESHTHCAGAGNVQLIEPGYGMGGCLQHDLQTPSCTGVSNPPAWVRHERVQKLRILNSIRCEG